MEDSMNGIYTDLACEIRELSPDLEGISEQTEEKGEIHIRRVGVITEAASRKIGKAIGNYVSLDAERLIQRPKELFSAMEQAIADEIRTLLRFNVEHSCIMVVGLGNRSVTPDSLGPRTVERVMITRHIKRFVPDLMDFDTPAVCAFAPGVLGITGIETTDFIKGVANKVKPDCVIAVDSLASRRAARISTTVQISDAGISPGSGVGNRRTDISRETIGVRVISIGVPLVVRASTIIRDFASILSDNTDGGKESLASAAEKLRERDLEDMIVTPKDIDTIADDMSKIVAGGINRALYGSNIDKVLDLLE